jgi:DNA-binding NarL/FixJ family response regulator
MIRIVLVDDQPLARYTMGYFLNTADDLTVVGEAGDGQEGVEVVRVHQPDVVLMDYSMPVLNGAKATAEIARTVPSARVIGISHNDSQDVGDAMRNAGAVDFVNKRSPMVDLIAVIRKAAAR